MQIKTKKSLGQNFLINRGVLDKIVAAAELSNDDTVLEIGPGTGLLTELLAQQAGKVVAVEKDRRLIANLREKFGSIPNQRKSNVHIIEGDILQLNIENLLEIVKLKIENSHYKVVGNIPYYITSHLLKIVFESWPTPTLIVLTVQKEVAQRIMAPSTLRHGSGQASSGQAKPLHTNLLALSVQYYSEPKIVGYVSRGSFRPIPKVDSAIVKLVPRTPSFAKTTAGKQDLGPTQETKKLFELIRVGFSGKRKQLLPLLAKHLPISRAALEKIFEELSINKNARAENLSLEQWIMLPQNLK